jgi:hypothetical protein
MRWRALSKCRLKLSGKDVRGGSRVGGTALMIGKGVASEGLYEGRSHVA